MMADVNKTPRPKKPNFSVKEMEVLMEEIQVQAATLLSSFQTGDANKKKSQIWSDICEKVNAVGGNNRTLDQIKKRWKDTKKAVLDKNQLVKKTGGGPAAPPLPFEDVVLGILGETSLTQGVIGGKRSRLPLFACWCLSKTAFLVSRLSRFFFLICSMDCHQRC
jgi:hypothetical protein